MNAVQQATRRLLRGRRASAFLAKLGIDPKRYWLLMDLFDELSDRGEVLDQFGRNGVALRVAAWIYAAFTAVMAFVLSARQPPAAEYLSAFLAVTALILLTVLLSEAGNSLVNPVESVALAHQPVNGATYTAAKLSHLGRIILYLVPGINAAPAVVGLTVKDAHWFYPLLHLSAALAAGVVAALLCCSLYGWLIRLLPARRLKAAGQLAGTMPLLAVIWWDAVRGLLARSQLLNLLPSQPAGRWFLGGAVGCAAIAVVALGIRSLSADYLIRVSSIMQGRSSKATHPRTSWTGRIVGRVFGGQPARAGFAFVSQMARRDFHFRRQAAPMLVFALLGCAPVIAGGWRTEPFSGRFTTAHLLPHLLGLALFFICSLLAYGSDFKAAWVFLMAPGQVFGRFARGIYAALCVPLIVIPHLLMLLFFGWAWGLGRAGLFVAYSAVICAVYLALELRLIDGAPFSKQVDAMRGAALFPLMIVAGASMAFAVGLQYFFVFRSPAIAATVIAASAPAAYFLTRASLRALAASIRYDLGLLAAESGTLYKEIDA